MTRPARQRGGRQAARRRYAHFAAGAGQLQDQNSAAVNLRARRQRIGRHDTGGGLIAYTSDRMDIHPQTQLTHFKSILQADAYVSFNALSVDVALQEAACWAHARRKFHDRHAAITTEALRRIAALYLIKAEIRCKPPHEKRLLL